MTRRIHYRRSVAAAGLTISSTAIAIGFSLLVQAYLNGRPPDIAALLLLFMGVAVFAPAAGAQAAFLIDKESGDTLRRVDSFTSDHDGGHTTDHPRREGPEQLHLHRQEAILRDIYGQGLAQAKVSFRASMTFAAAGAGLLLIGIALAVVNAGSSGLQYSAVVSGLSGVVVNVVSGLFFVESNRTRREMCHQGLLLRQESREDRMLHTAQLLTRQIGDDHLRDDLRATLATMLTQRPTTASGRARASVAKGGVPASRPAPEGRKDRGDRQDVAAVPV